MSVIPGVQGSNPGEVKPFFFFFGISCLFLGLCDQCVIDTQDTLQWIFKSFNASFDTYYKSTLEANLEAVDAAAFEANLKLIGHMNIKFHHFSFFCFYQNVFFFLSTDIHQQPLQVDSNWNLSISAIDLADLIILVCA